MVYKEKKEDFIYNFVSVFSLGLYLQIVGKGYKPVFRSEYGAGFRFIRSKGSGREDSGSYL